MIKPPTAGTRYDGPVYRILYSGAPFAMSGSYPVVQTLCNGSYFSQVTPGWKSLKGREKKYSSPWHNFSYHREVRTESPGLQRDLDENGSAIETFGPVLTEWSSATYNTWNTLTGEYPWPQLDSGAKALSRIQGRISSSSVNLAQAFAERHQAVDMISKRFRLLVNVATAIRRGNLVLAAKMLQPWASKSGHRLNFKDVKANVNNLANYWLEYQYGWRPLLSDIQGSAEQIAEAYQLQKPFQFTGTATSKVYNVPDFLKFLSGAGHCIFVEFAKYSYIERSRYVVETVVDEPGLRALSQTGISNPLLLAWELLPYSFVVDWALPVGQYLQQLQYAWGMHFVRGSVSIQRTGVADTWIEPYFPQNGGSGQATGGGRHVEMRSKSRQILTDFPYMKFPSFQPKLGTERALSAISLLAQVFTTGRTSRR